MTASIVPPVDAREALADLMEVSAQVIAAAVLREDGSLEAATIEDEERARAFAEGARALLEAAREAAGQRRLTQVEVAMPAGSAFVVDEGHHAIAATTGPRPTTGLVVYDLKTCLRLADEEAGDRPGPRA